MEEKLKQLFEELENKGIYKEDFSLDQMQQIREGLKAGVDVSIYAKPEFSWRQMEETRLGLEKRLDVSVYAKKEFSWEQMEVIRWGLEKGLDVNVYAKLEYDDDKMYEILHSLEAGLPKEIVKQEIANPNFSAEEMSERREKLDEELYKLGKEGLLEKYGITPEKENSEVEKDENTLDASEEISL